MKKIATLLLITLGTLSLKSQTYVTKIERNNVRAHAVSLGLLFNNLSDNLAGFEAPKDFDLNKDPLTTIYGSTLWLGAIDAGNNQYVAAQTYRQAGNDYKAGPTDAFSAPSSWYNKLWRITKEDIDSIKMSGLPTKNINEWPGVYTTVNGAEKLAPFFDNNGNGIYDPIGGDYPIFPGDEALFFIYNDDTLHTESTGRPLGVEIKGFLYQYSSRDNEFLNNTVFVDYYITNKSNREYIYLNAGIWTDFDLGDYSDDRVGVSPSKNMYYAYNAKDSDSKYGNTPPAMGVKVMNETLYSALGSGISFGSKAPSIDSQYFNLMNGKFPDGTVMTDKGNGYNTGGTPTRFLYNGNPCTNAGWTEESGGAAIGDRRMVGSVRFNSFKPNEQKRFTVAYTYAKATTGGAKKSLCKLLEQTDSLQNWFDKQPALSTQKIETPKITIYPNPATQNVTIDLGGISDNMEVSLYDITGKLITTITEKTINVSGLAKGLYIIKGKAGQSHFTKKLQVE